MNSYLCGKKKVDGEVTQAHGAEPNKKNQRGSVASKIARGMQEMRSSEIGLLHFRMFRLHTSGRVN